jgi:ATP-dependent HslUV protease subunit HslV
MNNRLFTKLPFFTSSYAALASKRTTTILCVRKNGKVVMAGDGQVTAGHSVMKGNAKKVRRLKDNVLVGFAGSTADAITLVELLEKKLDEHPAQLMRACVDLAKEWRSTKMLRTLEVL